MAIYILIGINFLLIIGLSALILKANWLEYFRSKISLLNISQAKITNNKDQDIKKNQTKIINYDNQNIKNQSETDEFNSNKGHIHQLLNSIKTPHSIKSINLDGTINKINDQLINLTPEDINFQKIIRHNLSRIHDNQVSDISTELASILTLLHQYQIANSNYKDYIRSFYNDALTELSEELKKFRKLKDILANSATTKVYEKAKRKYSTAFYGYITLFLITVSAALSFSLYIVEKKSFLTKYGMDKYDYWTIKISAIFIFITIITFLIKQATHYQKKKDEAERTMLELKALPSYLADLESKDATSLRKDLASKYFGKSNDNSTLNEIGNIISEQLKTSVELTKASTEIIKTQQDKGDSGKSK